MRIDLYGLVHKAQRYYLFGFARDLGRADLGASDERARIGARVSELVELLRDHAQNEERYIHPLFARLGSPAHELEQDHHDIDARLAELLALVDSERWDELYPCVTRFIGEYLLHLDAEERRQREDLWPNYSDETLGAVFARFKAERAVSADRADFALLVPALSISELTPVLERTRKNAPESSWRARFDLVRIVLGDERWAEVEGRLTSD